MLNDIDNMIEPPPPKARPHDDSDDPRPEDASPLTHPLPPGLVMTEWAVGLLRTFLTGKGLERYQISYCTDLDMDDIDRHLAELGEAEASWQPLAAAWQGGEPLSAITHAGKKAKVWPSGVLHLKRHRIVLARWYWVDEIEVLRTLWLMAAPSASKYAAMREEIRRNRRRSAARKWEIIRGGWQPAQFVSREEIDEAELLLGADMRRRVEAEIVDFFKTEVAALYARLHVPYRRGVLMHGPPGNGKTSLIRLIGASLPEIPMLVLRPPAQFNSDSLATVMKRWKSLAPAVLIIEDLDWLLQEVNISGFLNALDGIDAMADGSADSTSSDSGGLLLLATTNHPERLDPALNNRPGRFDVVVEVKSPDRALRRRFFETRLDESERQSLDALVGATGGLSFAHLHEILRAGALSAIHDGRSQRTSEDLLAAVKRVREADEAAHNGFPAKPDAPFGLAPRRARVSDET